MWNFQAESFEHEESKVSIKRVEISQWKTLHIESNWMNGRKEKEIFRKNSFHFQFSFLIFTMSAEKEFVPIFFCQKLEYI